QRRQLLLEGLVVVRAAQPAGVPKVDELHPAHRALAAHQAGGLLDVLDAGAGPLGGGLLVGLVEVLVGAVLAQVQLLDLVLADDSGDVQGGGFRTLLTFHGRGPQEPVLRWRASAILTGGGTLSSRAHARRRGPRAAPALPIRGKIRGERVTAGTAVAHEP